MEEKIEIFAPDYSDADQTRVFRMGSGRFAVELLFRYSWIWILSLSFLAVVGIVLGITVDLRWMVIGLMVICIGLPMILAFLYYYYGLRRDCYVNYVSHRIVKGEDGLIMRVMLPDPAPENVNNTRRSGGDPTDEKRCRYRDEFFPYSSMGRFVTGSKSAIVPLRAPFKGFIWIPADAFGDEAHLASFLKMLDSEYERRNWESNRDTSDDN
ncbi:MAG: hypothetical protein K2N88_03505 [Muribaculaceae bacterium]|nr:hypothetical protein [Muribaculaceae bacterium]